MKKTANELIAAFATGETPTGADFSALITAAYNVPEMELYDRNGVISSPFKVLIDKTTVKTNYGAFDFTYEHVGFSEILIAIAVPIHETVVIKDIDYIMSATFTVKTTTNAAGRAFLTRDNPLHEDDIYSNGFAKVGDVIQYMIIGR